MHESDVLALLPFRDGHFRYESGHHGRRWVDLERLCLRPEPVRALAETLAGRLARHDAEIVCGPLVEGAFVALMAAPLLGARFVYTERVADPDAPGLYPVRYPLPRALRGEVRGRRVVIINDVISAGSAVRGTVAALRACDARVVAIGALAVLGSTMRAFAREQGLDLEALVDLPHELWPPDECPLCEASVRLDETGAP